MPDATALLRRPFALISCFALAAVLALAGCDTAGPADVAPETPAPEASTETAGSALVDVALLSGLPGGSTSPVATLQGSGATSTDVPYLCAANVLDPGTEQGYRTLRVALAFPRQRRGG